MERKLLERLTGAVVLVLVVVVVAPLTLNGVYEGAPERAPVSAGPADTDTRIFFPNTGTAPRAEPPAEVVEPSVVETRPLDAPDAAIISEPGEPAVTPEPEPAVAVAEPAEEPAVTAAVTGSGPEPQSAVEPRQEPVRTQPAAASTSGQWQVQLGSFSQRENAENLAGNVRKGGFSATVTGYQRDGRAMYRVRSGPFASRAAADERIRELASMGYRGIVVNPDEG